MSFIQTPSTKEAILNKCNTIFNMCITKNKIEYIPTIEKCKAMVVSKVSYSEINKILNGIYHNLMKN